MAAPTLAALPNEILSLITRNLEHPRDILHLSLANRRLYEFSKLDGWKEFLKGRFGLSGRDADARNTVHGITTLYRNWDRKAFLARYLRPSNNTVSLNNWQKKMWKTPSGQTMGYRPCIDSYEEMQGGWADRREVLAWSAGTHILLRNRETGSKAAKAWEDQHEANEFDDYKNLASWYSYKVPNSREGRDDITALRLLRPHQREGAPDCIAFGTASGQLSLLQVDLEGQHTKLRHLNTGQRPVGTLSISSSSHPIIATTLNASTLALYSVDSDQPEEEQQLPLSEVEPVILGSQDGRLASCNFLSDDKVAVGLGPSYEPIHVFEVTPTGISPEPLRKFSLDSKYWAGVRTDGFSRAATSVYPIIPLSSSSQAGSAGGHVFLSGGYDGIIRLHDMRSPHDFETMYWDVTNDSSVYSLATQGLERIVVGTSMHNLLKVFDLRLSGSHAYRSVSLPSVQEKRKPTQRTADYADNKIVRETINHSGTTAVSGGWNVFLYPRNRERAPHTGGPRTDNSPVYSLSMPSSTSPSLYAGVEGAVMGIDFLSIMDKHPDPLFSRAIERFPDSGVVDLKGSFNQSNDVLNLGMYEQGNEQALGMQLMVQDGVSMAVGRIVERRDYARFQGLDERWKDSSDDLERWSHGRGQGGRGRGGRNRGGNALRGRGRGRGTGNGW